MSIEAELEEVLSFVENQNIIGKETDYEDVHLIASAVLDGVPIWPLDKKLAQTADSLHINYLKNK